MAKIKRCDGVKCVIVGGGPIGLRAAIEFTLLGADVTVIEARPAFTRYNILHLWDWVCQDLLEMGVSSGDIIGKSFFHVGTKELQLMLLKVAVVLGVRFYSGCKFTGTTQPAGGNIWGVNVTCDTRGHNIDCPKTIPANLLIEAGGAQGPVKTALGFESKKSKGATAVR